MVSTYIMEDNLLYSESADIDVNSVKKKYFHSDMKLPSDQVSGYCDLSMLTLNLPNSLHVQLEE